MFSVPTLTDIRAAILRDVQSLNPQADISSDSDTFIRASALASLAEGIYAHQSWAVRQFFPDTADADFLEKHAAIRGLSRRNATYASGRGAQVFGNVGAVIPEGAQIATKSGHFYVVLETATIGAGGSVWVRVQALEAGQAFNLSRETPASFMAAPAGCQSDCVLNQVLGGTDAESDSALLERLLTRIRRPPAGGNKYDYKNWALEVDGVDAAYVFPLRRGLGTVDIAITSANDVPSDETLRRVQAYIDEMRPVTAREALVVKPDVVRLDFNVRVKLSGVSLAEMTQAIEAALGGYFAKLMPAEDFVLSQCEAVVSDLIGVVDRQIVTPSANRTANKTTKIEWFRLGRVTVSEM